MMPMQVAAKAPRVVICQEGWMKQASIVYQFQSICLEFVSKVRCEGEWG